MITFDERHFSNFFNESDTPTSDVFDFDNGSILIYKDNLKKYLDRHNCRNESELKDSMWFDYGIVVRII